MAKKAKIKKLPNKIESKKRHIDFPLLIIIFILLTFGLVMMFSASYANAFFYKGDGTHYIVRQIIIAGVGVILMTITSFIPYKFYKPLAPVIYGAAIILNILPLVFVSWSTFKRWLVIPGTDITVQPSEFAKIAVIIMFSTKLVDKSKEELKGFRTGFLSFGMMVVPFMGLTLLQNHLSGTVIIAALAGILMMVGGIPIMYLLPLIPAGLLGIFGIYKSNLMPHINSRIDLWRNPFLDPGDDGYQSIQSLFAIASGGLLGRGLGNSRQKFSYLPEPQNDFIFSIISEELGFLGSLAVILLFVAFVVRGMQIALRTKDLFGKYLVVGIVMQVGMQALLNIAVVTNTIPNTGISLPFFSQGGTALMILLAEMGIVLNISREAELEDD